MATVGQIVREARVKANLTLEELAKQLGLRSIQYLSEIERDSCSLAPKHYRAVSKTLHVSLEQLIEANVAEYVKQLKQKVG